MERTENSRLLLSFIHSLFCKKEHPEECSFYSDIELADCWELPDIVCWTMLTKLVMDKMNTNEEGLLKSIVKVHKVLEGLHTLSQPEQNLFKAIIMEADLSYVVLAKPASGSKPLLVDSVSGLPDLSE